jgi:hypothetical protein
MRKILLLFLFLQLRIVIFAADFAFEARGLVLSDVAGVVGKHYGLSIFFATPEMGAKPVNGNLTATSEDDALRVLGFLAGTKYSRDGNVVFYGSGVTGYAAFPSGVITQEQAARIEGVSLVGGYAVVKGDEITHRNLSEVFNQLRTRKAGRARVIIADVTSSKADALQDMLDRAKVEVTWTGPVQHSRFNIGLDFRSILDFLKDSSKNKILLDTEISLLSGEEVEHAAGKVLERPLYVRANQSDQDLVTRYDRLQLGLVFKLTGYWLGDSWQIKYSIEDSDYITEQKKTAYKGVEYLREGERRLVVKLKRTVDVSTRRMVPVLAHITGKRFFTWETHAGDQRVITVFMEMLENETPPQGVADAPASAAP